MRFVVAGWFANGVSQRLRRTHQLATHLTHRDSGAYNGRFSDVVKGAFFYGVCVVFVGK